MSAYGTKVVAVLDTQSAFGVTIKQMRDYCPDPSSDDTLNIPLLSPANPIDGDLWFDKASLLKLKIFVDDGNSSSG